MALKITGDTLQHGSTTVATLASNAFTMAETANLVAQGALTASNGLCVTGSVRFLSNGTDDAQGPEEIEFTTDEVKVTGSLTVTANVTLANLSEVGTDTDKFLCSDSGVIKYVDGSNLATYIGAVSTSANNTFTGNNTFSAKLSASNGISVTDGAMAVMTLNDTDGYDLTAGSATISSNVAITGTLNVTGDVTLNGSIVPDSTANAAATKDLGSSANQWKDLYLDGKLYCDQLGEALDCDNQNMTNVDIDSGAIDGTTIGAASPAAGTFLAVAGTNATFSGKISGSNGVSITDGGSAAVMTLNDTDGFDLTVGSTNISSNTAITGTLDTTGAVQLHSTLNVDGAANFDTHVTLQPDADLTARSFITYSDATLKTDIKPLDSALDKVMSMRGVSYEFINQNKADGATSREIGFLAQEMNKTVPEVVYGAGDGNLGIDYAKLTSVLVEAIKDQQSQIQILRNDLQAALSKK